MADFAINPMGCERVSYEMIRGGCSIQRAKIHRVLPVQYETIHGIFKFQAQLQAICTPDSRLKASGGIVTGHRF